MSMIGLKLMSKIDKRLRQAFPEKSHLEFGGVVFYLFGDFNQLPPVGDTSLLANPRTDKASALHGKLMFLKFDKVFKLTQIMSQSGDEQRRFREVLERLGSGRVTDDDYELLKSRFVTNIACFETNFGTSLRLMAKKEGIAEYNQMRLRQLNKPVCLIRAKHNNLTAMRGSSDDAQGLEPILWLAEGSRVMLTHNLWTAGGLCNGTLGTVVDILYEPGNIENMVDDFPLCVMIRFDNYTGPTKYNGLLPVVSQTVSFKKSGISCTRKQFPLRTAYAITVHKSQGITLEKAVVDIGSNEFSLGLSYVALSRVKTIEGLALEPSFPKKRLLDVNQHAGWTVRREAMNRLQSNE